jgi:hypothetical protein
MKLRMQRYENELCINDNSIPLVTSKVKMLNKELGRPKTR